MKFLFVIIGILLVSNYVSSQACHIAFLQIVEEYNGVVETVTELNLKPGQSKSTKLGVELTCKDGKVKACIRTSCATVETHCDFLYVYIIEDNKKISCNWPPYHYNYHVDSHNGLYNPNM